MMLFVWLYLELLDSIKKSWKELFEEESQQ